MSMYFLTFLAPSVIQTKKNSLPYPFEFYAIPNNRMAEVPQDVADEKSGKIEFNFFFIILYSPNNMKNKNDKYYTYI